MSSPVCIDPRGWGYSTGDKVRCHFDAGTSIAAGSMILIRADEGKDGNGPNEAIAAGSTGINQGALYGVTTEATPAGGGWITVITRGEVEVTCTPLTETIKANEPLVSSRQIGKSVNGLWLGPAREHYGYSIGTKILAIAMQASIGTTAGQAVRVMFNGIEGFGTHTDEGGSYYVTRGSSLSAVDLTAGQVIEITHVVANAGDGLNTGEVPPSAVTATDAGMCFGVVMADSAQAATTILVATRGTLQVSTDEGTTAIVEGSKLILSGFCGETTYSLAHVTDHVAGSTHNAKIIGVHADGAAGATAELNAVYFNGIEGFGSHYAV